MLVTKHPELLAVPCTIMRAGTSKGLFFHDRDLPEPGAQRDAVLMAALGSSDLLQIDGLGGSRLVTSKIAIVKPSTRPDADVDYTYAIVPPARGIVVYTSNCGNISSGVGPFAIDAGLVDATGPIATVRIFNTNTKKILVAHVPVSDGVAGVTGDFAIPGVPGTGAEIFMDYTQTIGAKTGHALPTGRAVDTIALEDGRTLEVTIGDVANPCVFLRASDVGASGSELPDQIDSMRALLDTLREARGKAAQRIGLCEHWTQAERDSPALPLVVLIAPPATYADAKGETVDAATMDLRARLIFYNRCHESMAGTGSMCTAAMSRVPGSIVHQAVPDATGGTLRIGHPLGVMTVAVEARSTGSVNDIVYTRLGFSRTARRLMEGVVYVPRAAIASAVTAAPVEAHL
ncbi:MULTISPECIES: 2-methylaconitate cis-trans isomerase PrpF family protein [Paraburkholderia]|uniref:2-methylaconitate cis-trans isomerase PrpF family protein n=1 Tax=Paraburkholderia TaxID=1822464 RepID=UPI0022545E1A|nr:MULTISPECIES: PrpF domain-containing protein [Paraburkholderia]MCX4163285.1 PrpF protein [Paraburkholderia megapolitana]MDN7158781.1 PrpF protein [Paraburkholderia sp. CHISQ3]MDQ6495828.1 PrpF protein [Paraburkholderia megapolitana]